MELTQNPYPGFAVSKYTAHPDGPGFVAPWWAREDARKDVPLFMPESDFTELQNEEYYLKNIAVAGNRYRVWWCIFLKKYPSYGACCPIWNLFTPEDWMSLLWEQPSFAEKCRCWHSIPVEKLLLLLEKYPELKPMAEKALAADLL